MDEVMDAVPFEFHSHSFAGFHASENNIHPMNMNASVTVHPLNPNPVDGLLRSDGLLRRFEVGLRVGLW